MRVTLTVIGGPHTGQVFSFAGHDTFLVGRSKRAHFRLPSKDRFFSRVHFLVEVNPPQCRLMDMGSRNGTYVNGQRVEETVDLKDKDQIRAGRTVLRVSVEASDLEPVLEPEPAPAPEPAPEVEAVPVPVLEEPVPVLPLDEEELVPVSLPDFDPEAQDFPEVETVPAICRLCDSPVTGADDLPLPDPPALLCRACLELIYYQDQFIDGYHIVRAIGKGSMGVVYLAVRKQDDIAVALKMIIPAVSGTTAQLKRFLREAEILQQLSHPNIVSFRDSGESSGKIFFAMDYVRGRDASQILRSDAPLAVSRGVSLVCQLLEALDYAHARGFVHRDIKPANLLVSPQRGREVVKLADFGLARVYQSSQLSGLTMSGDIGGTVAFMAPEQITHYREARPPVDQYAAAATLYNLLTAQYIYDLPREFPKQLALILNEDAVSIRKRRSDVPEGLATVIHRALSRVPNDRFNNVREFHTALSPFAR
jgi:eukaryotic-like serine/threonine-protein kinase